METSTKVGIWTAVGIAILLIICMFTVFQCRTIRAGERGVVLTWVKVEPAIWGEGIHMKRFLSQKVVRMNVKIHKIQEDVGAASKDLQEVTSTVAMNFHLDPSRVNNLVQEIGTDYSAIVINPAINELTKAATASYTAEELITKREEVKQKIRESLSNRLGKYYILVDDFAIINFDFSKTFNEAIEAKQTATQNAIKAERDLERIKVEAEQRIASARAEAESTILNAKAQAESLALQRAVLTPDLIKLRAIEKWNGQLPVYSGGGSVPFIDIKQ